MLQKTYTLCSKFFSAAHVMYDAKNIKQFCLFLESAFLSENQQTSLIGNKVRALYQHRFSHFSIPEKLNDDGIRSLTLDLFMGIISEENACLRSMGMLGEAESLESDALNLYSGLCSTQIQPVVDYVDVEEFKSSFDNLSHLKLFNETSVLTDKLNELLSDANKLVSISKPIGTENVNFSELLMTSSILEFSSDISVSDIRRSLKDTHFKIGDATFSSFDIIMSHCNSVLSNTPFSLNKNPYSPLTYTQSLSDFTSRVESLMERVLHSLESLSSNRSSIYYLDASGEKCILCDSDLDLVIDTIRGSHVLNVTPQQDTSEYYSSVNLVM